MQRGHYPTFLNPILRQFANDSDCSPIIERCRREQISLFGINYLEERPDVIKIHDSRLSQICRFFGVLKF
jgi:hypothetical protein